MENIFVITSHIPSSTNCIYLANTLKSVVKHHPESTIIVVDNASPFDNVRGVLKSVSFSNVSNTNIHYIRQNESLLQLGSWRAAHAYITKRKYTNYTRVITLQHSTSLKRAVSPQRCPVMSLSKPKHSSFYWKPTFEARRFGAMWFTSRVLEDLNITCAKPCINSSTLLPTNNSKTWKVIPHSAMAFSRKAWMQLRVFLDSGKMVEFFSAVQNKTISAKEFNGHTERLSGILQAWINNGWKCNQNTVHKDHGNTMASKPREFSRHCSSQASQV